MILSEEERAELPRELFALVCRRLELASEAAMEGQRAGRTPQQIAGLSARLHDAGRDLMVIADVIAVIAGDDSA